MLIFNEYAGGSQRKSAESLGTNDDDSVSSSSADMSKLTLASGTEAVQQDSSLDSWLGALDEKRYLSVTHRSIVQSYVTCNNIIL